MLFLILAIVSSVLVSVIMRLSTGKTGSEKGMLLANYITCLLIAGISAGGRLFPREAGLAPALGMGAFNGLMYLMAFVLFQFNVKKNGVVLSSSFMKLGLLVPMIVSVVLFRETPGITEITGFILALIAIVLINYERNASLRSGSAPALILLLLAGGSGDAMSKVFEELGNRVLAPQFLFYTFLSALILCALLLIKEKQLPTGRDFLYGAMIGIPNYFSSFFLLRSLSSLPAVIAYPTFSIASILIVSVIGVLVFKERLRRIQWAGLFIVLISLALLNLKATS